MHNRKGLSIFYRYDFLHCELYYACHRLICPFPTFQIFFTCLFFIVHFVFSVFTEQIYYHHTWRLYKTVSFRGILLTFQPFGIVAGVILKTSLISLFQLYYQLMYSLLMTVQHLSLYKKTWSIPSMCLFVQMDYMTQSSILVILLP